MFHLTDASLKSKYTGDHSTISLIKIVTSLELIDGNYVTIDDGKDPNE